MVARKFLFIGLLLTPALGAAIDNPFAAAQAAAHAEVSFHPLLDLSPTRFPRMLRGIVRRVDRDMVV